MNFHRLISVSVQTWKIVYELVDCSHLATIFPAFSVSQYVCSWRSSGGKWMLRYFDLMEEAVVWLWHCQYKGHDIIFSGHLHKNNRHHLMDPFSQHTMTFWWGGGVIIYHFKWLNKIIEIDKFTIWHILKIQND